MVVVVEEVVVVVVVVAAAAAAAVVVVVVVIIYCCCYCRYQLHKHPTTTATDSTETATTQIQYFLNKTSNRYYNRATKQIHRFLK